MFSYGILVSYGNLISHGEFFLCDFESFGSLVSDGSWVSYGGLIPHGGSNLGHAHTTRPQDSLVRIEIPGMIESSF